MADEFADDAMVHGLDRKGLFYSRRREERGELLQIAFVIDNGVRRGIAHRAEIGEIFYNRGFHDEWLTAAYDYKPGDGLVAWMKLRTGMAACPAKASTTPYLRRAAPVRIQEVLLPSRSLP